MNTADLHHFFCECIKYLAYLLLNIVIKKTLIFLLYNKVYQAIPKNHELTLKNN